MWQSDQVRMLFGLESEYFIAPAATEGRFTISRGARLLLKAVARAVPVVMGSGRWFLPNGGCAYIDLGCHPEYATPECETPDELVRFALAGDLLFLTAAHATLKRCNRLASMRLWRGSVTYRKQVVNCASHENYAVPDRSIDAVASLDAFLVSRIIYAGSGGLRPSDGGVRFTISPRANRAVDDDGYLLTVKDSGGIRGITRLHLACGDALAGETGLWLRTAATALVLAAFEVIPKRLPQIDLADIAGALSTAAYDTACSARLPLTNGQSLTAIDIQWRYLDYVIAAWKAGRLPVWAGTAVELWASILDALEHDPASLDLVLDWRIRFRTLTADDRLAAVLTGEVEDSEAARHLRHLDRRFLWLGEGGLFADLDAAGVLRHGFPGVTPTWENGVFSSPATSRARLRASFVSQPKRACRHRFCDWDMLAGTVGGEMTPSALDRMYVDQYMPWQLNGLEELGAFEPPPSVVRAANRHEL